MKKTLVIVPVLFSAFVCTASADPWTASVDANITLTQYSYTDNWAGGEAGAMAWTFFSNSLAEKKFSEIINNKNTLKLLFGQTHSQDKDTKKWGKPDKSNDLIDFESVFRFDLKTYVDPFAAARIESQFLDTSNTANKRYFNPLTVTESFGVSRVLIKEEKREWSARFGAGFRQYVNRDFLVVATSKKETKTSNDGGFIFVNDFKTPLAEDRIMLTSKLTVFQAMFNSESDKLKGLPEENYWKTADVEWENIFTAGITKYLMVNLYTQLLYDKEVSKAGRFKQMLSLGLTYKLL